MPQHPMSSLHARGFGPFNTVEVSLGAQLTVILGDNATGKTHLMKLLYVAASVLQARGKSLVPMSDEQIGAAIAEKLVGVFRPNALGRLVKRAQGRSRADVRIGFGSHGHVEYTVHTASTNTVEDVSVPSFDASDVPVFLPSRELLSIFPGLVALYESRELALEETWRDTAELLARAPLRGPRESSVRELLQHIEPLLGGTVHEAGGVFHVKGRDGDIEAHLLAEGHRKLAMLARLVANGALLGEGYLFWDEPEANLNPAAQVAVAETIVRLAASGVQVFVATHSLFLIRELHLRKSQLEHSRLVGLSRDDAEVTVASSDDLAELPHVAALDAEIAQSRRYLADLT